MLQENIERQHRRCSAVIQRRDFHGITHALNHSIMKREWLNRFKIRDYKQAYRLIFEYLEAFYNTKRIHSHCNYIICHQMNSNEYMKRHTGKQS